MVDQALSVLEQYELDVKGVRKGRGNWIINCREGDFVLKEYGGGEERAKLQSKMTTQIHEKTGVLVQEIVPNKEGSLLTKDGEENTYTIQTYMEGRECNIKDEKECEAAVQTMARMHRGMIFSETEWGQIPVPYSLKKEFSKRNAELRRLRRYLKEKRKKNDFEAIPNYLLIIYCIGRIIHIIFFFRFTIPKFSKFIGRMIYHFFICITNIFWIYRIVAKHFFSPYHIILVHILRRIS